MSPPRFVHRKITAEQFLDELEHHDITPATFARIWCQNLAQVKRWANGAQDIPSWVPIALTAMRADGAMGLIRTAAAAMIEQDRLRPELGAFPYQAMRELPRDMEIEEQEAEHLRGDGNNLRVVTHAEHSRSHRKP